MQQNYPQGLRLRSPAEISSPWFSQPVLPYRAFRARDAHLHRNAPYPADNSVDSPLPPFYNPRTHRVVLVGPAPAKEYS